MPADSTDRLRVCLADGERLDPLRTVLADDGVTVETVDGPGTLDTAATGDCDLVVVAHDETTDPPVDGVAAVERAQAAVDCPVVLYAVGFPGADVAIDAMEAGAADAVFVPPERADLLRRRLRAPVEGHGFADPNTLLAQFFAHVADDLFVKDTHSRIAVGSGETGSPQGYDRDQLVGLTDYELFPPGLADALYEQERRIMATGEPELDVVEHFVEDGEDRWVTTSKAPRYDADGNVTGVVGGTREVTRIRRRERLVAALNEATQDLMRAETKADVCQVTVDIADDIATLPAVQVALDEDGRLRPAAAAEGLEEDHFDAHERWFWRAYETGEDHYIVPDGDGYARADRSEPETVDLAVLPLGNHGALALAPGDAFDEFTLDLANVLAGTVEASLDRADRERAIREREARLERQNRRLEQFATMVSHDLRNPLQVAVGAADMLDDSGHAERIRSALDQMDRLVDELLALARQGRLVGDPVEVDVATLARTAWQRVDTGEATLTVGDAERVVADRERLGELFENLFWTVLDDVEAGSVHVGLLADGDGLYVEPTEGGAVPQVEADPEPAGVPGENMAAHGQYIVSTIAAAYGWEISVTDGGRYEVTGLAVR